VGRDGGRRMQSIVVGRFRLRRSRVAQSCPTRDLAATGASRGGVQNYPATRAGDATIFRAVPRHLFNRDACNRSESMSFELSLIEGGGYNDR
jgi:hypothetical protein